jgi:methyltransferase family protein
MEISRLRVIATRTQGISPGSCTGYRLLQDNNESMIRHLIDRLIGKRGRKNYRKARITPEQLRTIGADESLLFEAISYNINKNDRALYNLLHCARMLNESARSLGETFEGKTVLEIGTSREPGLPLILLLQGCKDYYASNIRKLDDWLPEAYINLIRVVMSGMLEVTPRPVNEVLNWIEAKTAAGQTVGRLHQQYFHDLSPASAEQLELADNSMDIVFSLAVLEHVHSPQAVIENIYRMTRPGGWCLHMIDLRDHRDFDKPLEFLKLEESSYRASRPNGENRWRASDFIDAFASAGFEIVNTELTDGPVALNEERNCDTARSLIDPVVRPTRLEDCATWVTEAQRADFKPPFNDKSLQDLSVLSVSLLCRKPL